MSGLKVYISGKITGYDTKYVKLKFEESERVILEMNPKYVPVNPLKISPYSPKKTWEDYMAADIEALLHCDAIYMQKNWGHSKGARIEYGIAQGLDLIIMFEEKMI